MQGGIKVNGQYLDLSPGTDIFVEKRAKLFEEIDSTAGDFSYSFDFPHTTNNMAVLGFPMADVADKTIYNDVSCDIVGSDGIPIYSGILKVEKINSKTISASFFSGNYNWISLLDGNLQDLQWIEYDSEISRTTIIANISNTSGLVFPLVDLGGLASRGTDDLFAEDFTGAIYVKSIFNKIFSRAGLKYTGDLTQDWLFNNMVILKNHRNKTQLEADSCYVSKTSTTNRPTENVDYKITFQDETTFPYFDGDNNCFDLANSMFVAPVKMTVDVECTLEASFADANYSNRIRLYINGVYTFVDVGLAVGGLYNTAAPGNETFFTIKRTITLEAGDQLEIYSHWQESTGGTTAMNVISGTLTIRPVYIYHVFGESMVPNWKQNQFVQNILNLFNVITDFDPISKTVTFNLFEKLKSKTAVDISKYVDPETIETDFTDFAQGFAKRNLLSYQEGDDEDLREYNIKELIKYSAGVIEVDNDYLEGEKDLITVDFTSPISYLHPVFKASLERMNLVELEESDTVSFTAVTDSGGTARFAVSNNYFLVGDLVRVNGSTHPEYNGDFRVSAVGAGYIELFRLGYNVTATGQIAKLDHRYTDNDNVFLLVNIPDAATSSFSPEPSVWLESGVETSFSYAYFNLLNVGDTVNTGYLQGLSFGEVENVRSYQKTLIDTYWRSVQRTLNDPVKLRANFYFPRSVFKSLSPLVPVYLKTQQTTNLYYINNIAGYISSGVPCEVELIKL